MADTGVLYPGLVEEDTSYGTLAWTDYVNAKTDNGLYMSCYYEGDPPRNTYYAKASTFGAAVPAGATINGVVVEIQRYGDGGLYHATDNVVSLLVNGAVTGDNKAMAGDWITETTPSYGGVADVWGCALTAALVNQTNFGVVLAAQLDANAGGNPGTIYVDFIRLTVYYTAAAPASGVLTGVAMQPLMRY